MDNNTVAFPHLIKEIMQKTFLGRIMFFSIQIKKNFVARSFLFNKLTKGGFQYSRRLFLNQNIRLINPKTINMEVHNCSSNCGGQGGWCTMITRYVLWFNTSTRAMI